MKNLWDDTDEGNTLGTIGSEGGKIIRDEEHDLGARITLEGKGDVSAASVVLDIYGVITHTCSYNSIEEAKADLGQLKSKIEKLLYHYEIDESMRDSQWDEQMETLVNEIESL